jgi:hypothetical protein
LKHNIHRTATCPATPAPWLKFLKQKQKLFSNNSSNSGSDSPAVAAVQRQPIISRVGSSLNENSTELEFNPLLTEFGPNFPNFGGGKIQTGVNEQQQLPALGVGCTARRA